MALASKYALRILVALAYIVMVLINIFQSNSNTLIGHSTNSQISNAYPTYFTPAGFTFSVWAVIYIFSGLYAFYQVLPCFYQQQKQEQPQQPQQKQRESNDLLDEIAYYQLINFTCNCVWSIVFAYELFWVSVVIIVINTLALAKSYSILHCGCDSFNRRTHRNSESSVGNIVIERSWKDTLLISTCVSLNLSWIILATFLCFTVTLQATTSFVSTADWGVAWLLVAALVASYIAFTFADVAYIAVGVWALIGVASKQADRSLMVRNFSIVLIVWFLLVLIVGLVRRRNRRNEQVNEASQPMVSGSGNVYY